MFEAKAENNAAIAALQDLFAGHERGNVVLHDAIRLIMGCEPHEGAWDHCVYQARIWLEREYGIATWPEFGVGYRLCTNKEQAIDLPYRRLLRAARQARRGIRSSEAQPVEGLSVHLQKARLAQLQKLRLAALEINNQLRQAEPGRYATPVNPRLGRAVAAGAQAQNHVPPHELP